MTLSFTEAAEQFRQAIAGAGLTPPAEIKESETIERFSTNGKSGDDSGWYKFHSDGVPAGAFGDWRTDFCQTWTADIGRKLTREESKANRERIAEARKADEKERAKAASRAAELALSLRVEAEPARPDHPYLLAKGVKPAKNLFELPIERVTEILGYHPRSKGQKLTGQILIALIQILGKPKRGIVISSAELIDEQGRKSAIHGGSKSGGAWLLEPIPNDRESVVICEGVATALSIAEATGLPVIAALSDGNLPKISPLIPGKVIIAADLDKQTGTATQRAIEAARLSGWLAVPTVEVPTGTDFNDQAAALGLESVKEAILNASPIQPPPEEPEPTGQDEPDKPANPIPSMENRPAFVCLDDWHSECGRTYRAGVWLFATRADKAGNVEPVEKWICSPLRIEAVTHDAVSNNVGRLLRFKTTLGAWREWAMPMELLRGDGNDLRGELLSMGLEIDPLSRNQFLQYLSQPAPERRVHCSTSVGWSGDVFVLPDEVIGPNSGEVIFQSGERDGDEYAKSGTLEGWQEAISSKAATNPILCLALSGAFAGPLLGKLNGESGGVHLVGDSSSGKTTALEAACSVWGGGNFKRSWRATSNGMEGAAAMFNDSLLALDEISECEPREVGAIVYSLGNGRGKQRSSRTGRARPVARWRCFVLSSGERTIGTSMAEGGYRTKAGQSVRLLDVPATRKFGAWDDLCGYETGNQLADSLKTAAAINHGHAGRAFLEKLTRETRNLCDLLEQFKQLPGFNPPDAEGQDKRAAARFALMALAGELATEYQITGWHEGAALDAAVSCFEAWRALRGGGNDERRQILEAVAAFIERHGDSRFSHAGHDPEAKCVNRAGWFDDGLDGLIYQFNAEGLREALKGFDFGRALDVLVQAKVLPEPQANGERARFRRIGGRGVKVYPISLPGGGNEC